MDQDESDSDFSNDDLARLARYLAEEEAEQKAEFGDDFYSSHFKRLRFVSTIIREWSPALSVLDFRALIFVFDRTMGWKKEWEAISRKQCVKGIVDYRNGKRYSHGFTSCEKQAGIVLARLVARGVLKRRSKFSNQAGYEYSINRDFDPAEFPDKNLKEGEKKGGGETTLNGRGNPPSKGGGNRPEKEGQITPLKTEKLRVKRKKDKQKNNTADVSEKRSGSREGGTEKGRSRSVAFRSRSRKNGP